MCEYYDENEEFDLCYQEELELLSGLPPDEGSVVKAKDSTCNKSNSSTKSTVTECSNINPIVNSPQLSQISYDGHHASAHDLDTPKGPKRAMSTPLLPKQHMPAISDVLSNEPSVAPSGSKRFLPMIDEAAELSEEASSNNKSSAVSSELHEIGLRSKRRLDRDLFGAGGNLFDHNSYEDPIAKKARTEERRDLDTIEKILETRRRFCEVSNSHHSDNVSRLRALHEFKMRNLSHVVPQWPFMPLKRSDNQRIYVRFHSEEYEMNAMESIRLQTNFDCLGDGKQRLWDAVNEMILRKTSNLDNEVSLQAFAQPITEDVDKSTSLWVEKYKPRKYIDLLSDEMTNRSLLYWVKMWDKVVFGKEFKANHHKQHSIELNSFNKRTGKFESNGGWRQRKSRQQQQLNTNTDDFGRPIQKIALLCGPPGLGKTTLAHVIARHAGYTVREINASDDRSPEVFKVLLENGTQMSSVLNEDRRPNCIILDEIDGAPRQSIEFLVKFVSDSIASKNQAKGSKIRRNILKRPIICICNDIYDPALRPLRQMAFVVTFPPIESSRLTERLMQIAYEEHLKVDFGTLFALAEKSGNDVRSCISTMQFFNAQKKELTLKDVLNNNLGQKDRHQGLFDVWSTIFRIQRPKKQLNAASSINEEPQITMTDMSIGTRVRNVIEIVHSGGDYERLIQGVFENYLHQKMPDPNLNGIVEAVQWFCFSDLLSRQINQIQNYTVYPYLQYGFVSWHLLFASLAWPKINFPTRGFEFNQKSATQRNIFQSLRKGISPIVVGIGQGRIILMDTVPLLKHILSPQLRSVAIQLLSSKEQTDLRHTVEIMVDLGITYTQVKSADGSYIFQMEPDLDILGHFGYSGITLSYFGRQLITREIELERIRRAMPKTTGSSRSNLPNHLQTLKPKRIDNRVNNKNAKNMVSKDFFGRISHNICTVRSDDPKTDPIVKSPVWYRYKEGFNNAVRKDVHTSDLL